MNIFTVTVQLERAGSTSGGPDNVKIQATTSKTVIWVQIWCFHASPDNRRQKFQPTNILTSQIVTPNVHVQ